MFQPSNTWSEPLPNNGIRLLNGLASIQGPNYALTKTAQQWRAMVCRFDGGHSVSANHGPPTRTLSMVSHAKVAAALEGMQHFPPNVAFDVGPAKSLLAALMLYDLNLSDESSSADHPMRLFDGGSAHGGAWRCPFRLDSLGTASFIGGKVGTREAGWCPEGALMSSEKRNC